MTAMSTSVFVLDTYHDPEVMQIGNNLVNVFVQ